MHLREARCATCCYEVGIQLNRFRAKHAHSIFKVRPAHCSRILSASSLDGLDRSRRHPVALKVKDLLVRVENVRLRFSRCRRPPSAPICFREPAGLLVPASQCPRTIDRGSSWLQSVALGLAVSLLGLPRCARSPSQCRYQKLTSGRCEARGKHFTKPRRLLGFAEC